MQRLGVIPSLLLGLGLAFIGLTGMNYVVNSWWPFDVTRLDLVRDVALDRADSTLLLEAANLEIILAFLGTVLITFTGLALPLMYVLNKRFRLQTTALAQPLHPRFLVTLRQAMWVGFWVAFCIWLQMNRAFGMAIALLAAAVLILFEILLQVRTRATAVRES